MDAQRFYLIRIHRVAVPKIFLEGVAYLGVMHNVAG